MSFGLVFEQATDKDVQRWPCRFAVKPVRHRSKTLQLLFIKVLFSWHISTRSIASTSSRSQVTSKSLTCLTFSFLWMLLLFDIHVILSASCLMGWGIFSLILWTAPFSSSSCGFMLLIGFFEDWWTCVHASEGLAEWLCVNNNIIQMRW